MAQEKIRGPGRVSFALPAGAIFLTLLAKYAGLTLYGISAMLVEVPSFVQVGGSQFAFGWALCIAVLAFLALLGVVRSWHTNHFRLEKITTVLLICGFMAYSVVLVVRGFLLGEWSGASLAWLPIVMCFFPAVRRFSLADR